MKISIKFSAILLCLAIVGCTETGQQELTEIEALNSKESSELLDVNARKGGGSTGQIYLSVVVDDLKIASDGKGVYTNGINGISARIVSSDGNVSFITNNARQKNPRKLIFPDGGGYAIDLNSATDFSVTIFANDVDPAPFKIQDIPVGSSQIMAMTVWGYKTSGMIFRLIYNYGIGAGYITDKVLVSRIDTTTWTVESTDSDTSNPEATAALTSEYNKDLKGYYSVPFRMTFKAIN